MKYLYFLFFLSTTFCSYAQDDQKTKEIMAIINNQDSIPRSIFLDTSCCLKNLRLGQSNNWQQVWFDIDDTIKSISQFFDIRIQFDSHKKALKFHKNYLKESSENGPEIKNHKLSVSGISALKVYTQNKMMSKMFLEPYGFQAYCFLFVVDNYYVKLYTTCLLEYEPTYFQPFIEAARDKIKAAHSKG